MPPSYSIAIRGLLVAVALGQCFPVLSGTTESATLQFQIRIPPHCYELMQPAVELEAALRQKGVLCPTLLQEGTPRRLMLRDGTVQVGAGLPNAWFRPTPGIPPSVPQH